MINICTIKGTDTVSKGGENKPERGEVAEYLIPNLETTQMGHISTGARRRDRARNLVRSAMCSSTSQRFPGSGEGKRKAPLRTVAGDTGGAGTSHARSRPAH